MNIVLPGYGDLTKAVIDEFRTGWNMQAAKAAVEQKRIAQAQIERRHIDGVGRLRMQVSPTAYHYWGRRLGYDCWRDKKFLAEFERDNPGCRVKSRSEKTTILAPGPVRDKDAKYLVA
tara:strand:- start:6593 stop:6946 length:354 start_codon:yes stop_codon:yes gene_type:complete